MKVRVLDVADAEAGEAAAWYEGRLAGPGEQFLDAYAHYLEEIEKHPEQFSRMETIPDAPNIRRCLLA